MVNQITAKCVVDRNNENMTGGDFSYFEFSCWENAWKNTWKKRIGKNIDSLWNDKISKCLHTLKDQNKRFKNVILGPPLDPRQHSGSPARFVVSQDVKDLRFE